MTFPKHALVQFGGDLDTNSGPKEQWACGIRVYTGIPAGEYLAQPQAYASALAGKLVSYFLASANGMANTAHLNFVKVNNIGPDGRYVDAVTHQAAIGNTSGGAVGIGAPSFCSVAMTWETGVSRGHAHRGRIYMPNYSYTPVGAQISTANATSVAQAGAALLNIINSTLDSGTLVRPIVVSSLGAGLRREITGVSADNIYDVQRRRKNRLTSTRNTVSWP